MYVASWRGTGTKASLRMQTCPLYPVVKVQLMGLVQQKQKQHQPGCIHGVNFHSERRPYFGKFHFRQLQQC